MSCEEELEDGELSSSEEEEGMDTESSSEAEEKAPNACDVCEKEAAKYRCPGCGLRSCSLPCCRRHKTESGCDGQKVRTEFLPMSQMDNLTLLSDYRLLEEAGRVRERCRLDSEKEKRQPKRFHLLRACKARNIRLHLQPQGMQLSLLNQSRHERFSDTIFWTVKVEFAGVEHPRVLLGQIPESLSVATLVRQLLKPRSAQRLLDEAPATQLLNSIQEYASGDDHFSYFVQVRSSSEDGCFWELAGEKSLKENLRNVCLDEFPRISVSLPQYKHLFPLQTTLTGQEKEQTDANGNSAAGKYGAGRPRGGRIRKRTNLNFRDRKQLTKENRRLEQAERTAAIDRIQLEIEGRMRSKAQSEIVSTPPVEPTQVSRKPKNYFNLMGDFSASDLSEEGEI